MLELFSIFTKGGIVLFYFQGACTQLISSTQAVNESIKTILVQGSPSNQHNHKNLTIQLKLDNEFELIFACVVQKMLQLSYLDKLIDTIHLEFRDKYKNELRDGTLWLNGCDFDSDFTGILSKIENEHRVQKAAPRAMKQFTQSKKFEKTATANKAMFEQDKSVASTAARLATAVMGTASTEATDAAEKAKSEIELARENMKKKKAGKKGKKKTDETPAASKTPKKKGKEARSWDMGGKSTEGIDFSAPVENGSHVTNANLKDESHLKGTMSGDLTGVGEDEEDEDIYEEEEEVVDNSMSNGTSGKSSGMFSFLKNINFSTQQTVTSESLQPVLDKLKEHLTSKNVASEISVQLCDSLESSLVGRSYSTFTGLTSTAKQALSDALTKILSPKHRVNVLRDVMDAKSKGRPYVITFCGVNGVGKSTNLAKVCFWLLDNNYRVLVVGGDTFRAGAVEQLRTHVVRLANMYSEEQVQLYERGYGKDPAGLAFEAIKYAKERRYDVVLVDTAGRMQDNEPLMRALSKLVALNNPDLTLFVGEALVGNEAVDQLVKFNQSLIDNSSASAGTKSVIDGILLTKFDCIDDKVGAAISMTYITGQPIVFVGTGQQYPDLKSLNVKSVVSALLR
ncbi:hypothetical protein ACHWQZ_G014376 [Mnemiopsis leidyi]